ncbi:M14 family zinc carboxypeptidase [Patulibacter sp. NPDC049589]|uniref:M14 family zinc carboxypeptidase n=1 Tax=Patulibacter sp. NPDC049589 TaxID=3154731 RepID=UPI00342DD1E1
MKATRALLAVAATALAGSAALPAASVAADAPEAQCSAAPTFDSAVLSWDKFWVAVKAGDWAAAQADGSGTDRVALRAALTALAPKAVASLGAGAATAGGGAEAGGVGAGTPAAPEPPKGRNQSDVNLAYADYLVRLTETNPRVRVINKEIGKSSLGRRIAFYVVSTPANIANLDTPDGDAAYWRGVRAGDIPEEDGVEAAITRPAFGWITATPHGGESAAGESITRELYELAARTDCGNVKRLANMDLFLQLVRNPDGRDGVTRTTAYAFDPNRDFGTRNYVENGEFIPKMNEYPGLFFIDAHQQGGSAYFFPPNEDPVHHEISDFSLSTIQNKIGPALQNTFNDTSTLYNNYSQYDLFTPEYGDTVPSLIMGAAGMTYEKGNAEVYSKQVYDHYLAIDTTINTIANDKIRTTQDWVRQWQDAVQQGADCTLQPNKLVSPLHDELTPIPPGKTVCGYFFRPDQHTGDVAKLLEEMQEVGVKVFKLNSATTLSGVKEYGKDATTSTLPAGTLYIPMAQGMKHWIQSVMGENPFIPYPYYYDVVTWSYGLQRGLAGSGFLTQKGSVPTDLTQVGALDLGTAPSTPSAVYAFNTDSAKGLVLSAKLLSKGVSVSRATTAFDAAGKTFFSGAALVRASALTAAGVDLPALAKEEETPVYGLDRFPVATKALTKPKIGLYTGSATIPGNPLYPSTAVDPSPSTTGATDVTAGHCGLNGGTSFCEALFTLRVKDDMPADSVVPITQTQINAGELVTGGYTAVVGAGSNITGATATAVQAFVNGGGRYVNYGTNGATGGRNAGLTNVTQTSVPSNLRTPGSTYDATFDTSDPVAWGFDLGGWIYRAANSDPMFDGSSLTATSPNPASTAAVSYATDLNSAASLNGQKYGLSVNATGPGLLDGRPAVISSSPGAGHSTVFGWNPFYRAWKDQDERLVLNAAMYPTTVTTPADTVAAAKAAAVDPPAVLTAKTTVEENAPVKKAQLSKPVQSKKKAQHDTTKDFALVVKAKYKSKLKKAVKAAKIPKSIRKKIVFKTSGKKVKLVTLSIKNGRTDDFHDRQEWVTSLMDQVKKQKVKVKVGQM